MAEDPLITQIIKEVDLAKTGRFAPIDDVEDLKPFWKRPININGREVVIKQESVELRMEKASYQCFGNDGAYMQYLKRGLFPRGRVKSPVIPEVTYGENGHVIRPPKPTQEKRRKG